MDKVLLTGGTGFIGSHTASLLLESGFKVIIIDSLINSSEKVIEQLKKIIKEKNAEYINNLVFYKGSLKDENLLNKIFEKEDKKNSPIKGVIHFAGLKAVGESNISPLNYWENNVSGTIALLKIMNKWNCKTLIFSSSATIYGNAGKLPIKEDNKINPTNPYGNTKSLIETLLTDIFKSAPEEWRIANLRYFNPVGAHPSGYIGENPLGVPNNIFPIIAKVACEEISSLNIFGNDWDTHDGTGVRDYIHVMDVSEGHIEVFEYLKKNKTQILNLNLGTGIGTSVMELINAYEKNNNVKIPFKIVERRIGDVDIVVADNNKAKLILGWEPNRGLDEMCRDAWRWKSNDLKN